MQTRLPVSYRSLSATFKEELGLEREGRERRLLGMIARYDTPAYSYP